MRTSLVGTPAFLVYEIASCTLEWTAGQELFDGFEEVLLHTALMNSWEDHTAPISDADKTPDQFDQTLQAMYRKYVGTLKLETFNLSTSEAYKNP